MGKFINRYNNYNCIEKNDAEDISLIFYSSAEEAVFKALGVE